MHVFHMSVELEDRLLHTARRAAGFVRHTWFVAVFALSSTLPLEVLVILTALADADRVSGIDGASERSDAEFFRKMAVFLAAALASVSLLVIPLGLKRASDDTVVDCLELPRAAHAATWPRCCSDPHAHSFGEHRSWRRTLWNGYLVAAIAGVVIVWMLHAVFSLYILEHALSRTTSAPWYFYAAVGPLGAASFVALWVGLAAAARWTVSRAASAVCKFVAAAYDDDGERDEAVDV